MAVTKIYDGTQWVAINSKLYRHNVEVTFLKDNTYYTFHVTIIDGDPNAIQYVTSSVFSQCQHTFSLYEVNHNYYSIVLIGTIYEGEWHFRPDDSGDTYFDYFDDIDEVIDNVSQIN